MMEWPRNRVIFQYSSLIDSPASFGHANYNNNQEVHDKINHYTTIYYIYIHGKSLFAIYALSFIHFYKK
jgi:hypothetical protein